VLIKASNLSAVCRWANWKKIGIVVIFLCVVAVLLYHHIGNEFGRTLSFVSPRAAAFVTVNLTGLNPNGMEIGEMAGLIPVFSELQLGPDRDLLSWVDGEVTVAYVPASSGCDPVVIVQSRNNRLADEWLADAFSGWSERMMVALEQEQYRKITVTTTEPFARRRWAYTRVDDTVLLGSLEAVKGAVDTAMCGNSVADLEQYQELSRHVPPAKSGMVYLDPPQLVTASNPRSDLNLGKVMPAGMLISLQPCSGGIEGALFVPYPEMGTPAVIRDAPKFDIYNIVPGNAIMFAGLQDLPIYWTYLSAILDEAFNGGVSAFLTDLNRRAGLDIYSDLLDWLEDDIGWVVFDLDPGDEALNLVLVVDITNRAEALNKIRKIGRAFGWSIEFKDRKGQEYFNVNSGEDTLFSYAVFGNAVAIADSPAGIFHVIDSQAAGDILPKRQRFRRSAINIGDSQQYPHLLGYLDLEQTGPLHKLLPVKIPGLKVFGFGAHLTDAGIKGNVRLLF